MRAWLASFDEPHSVPSSPYAVKLGLNKNKPLEVYRDEFETQYIVRQTEYYAQESAIFLSMNSTSDYMKKAETRLAEEADRAKSFLDSSSFEKVSA